MIMKKINLLLVAFLLSVTSASAVDYTLTLKSSNCSSSSSFSVESGSSVTLEAKVNAGHAFKQWDDGNTDNPRTVTMTGDKTYTAIFSHKHTIQASGYLIRDGSFEYKEGTVTGGGEYVHGTTATLLAVAPAGCEFVCWSDGNTDNPRMLTVYSSEDYSAMFFSSDSEYRWVSKDGSVKIYQIDVDGNIKDNNDNDPNNCHEHIYWYDTYALAWKEEYPAVNQNFTFAIEAKSAATKAFCDYKGAGDAIPTFGIHIYDIYDSGDFKGIYDSGDFKMERIDGYIYGVDMNASAMMGEQGVKMGNRSLPFNVYLAFIGDETAAGETEIGKKVEKRTARFRRQTA